MYAKPLESRKLRNVHCTMPVKMCTRNMYSSSSIYRHNRHAPQRGKNINGKSCCSNFRAAIAIKASTFCCNIARTSFYVEAKTKCREYVFLVLLLLTEPVTNIDIYLANVVFPDCVFVWHATAAAAADRRVCRSPVEHTHTPT